MITTLWTQLSTATYVKKCCPVGESVQTDGRQSFFKEQFSCGKINESDFAGIHKTEIMKNLSFVYQSTVYNILGDSTSHWPPVGNLTLSFLNFAKTFQISETEGCVDVMNTDFYVFTYDKTWNFVQINSVDKLRKCCMENFSFDIFLHQCVKTNQEQKLNQNFHDILNDTITILKAGLPECSDDEVLVEYHSSVHKIKLHQSSLIITAKNSPVTQISKPGTFCVESTVGSYVDDSNPKASSKWIAKVCQHKSICNKIPCIRKCCKEGERMVFENKTICKAYDKHLDVKFHSFDIKTPLKTPSIIEPSGMCIIFFIECQLKAILLRIRNFNAEVL